MGTPEGEAALKANIDSGRNAAGLLVTASEVDVSEVAVAEVIGSDGAVGTPTADGSAPGVVAP
jgi:hypothetical protein